MWDMGFTINKCNSFPTFALCGFEIHLKKKIVIMSHCKKITCTQRRT